MEPYKPVVCPGHPLTRLHTPGTSCGPALPAQSLQLVPLKLFTLLSWQVPTPLPHFHHTDAMDLFASVSLPLSASGEQQLGF